jgi:O-antigen/teichoic acid export membrane protein
MSARSLFRLDSLRSLQLMQILRFGSMLLGSILVARNIHDRSVVGDFEFWVLLGSSTTFFWVSGIINTFIPYFHRQDKEAQRVLVYNVFLLLSGIAVLTGVFIWIGSSLAAKPLSDLAWHYMSYALLAAPAFLIEYLLLVYNRPRAIAAYASVSSVLYIAAFMMPYFFVKWGYKNSYSLELLVESLFGIGILRYGFLVILTGIFGKNKFSFQTLKPFLNKSWPIIIGLLFGGSMMYVDAYIIRIFFPADQFALFQYGARELPLTLLLANAISNVASGEIAQSGDNHLPSLVTLRNRSMRLMHQLFPLSIVLLIFSYPLYELVFTESYLFSAHIFDIYLLLIVSRVLFPQTVLLGLGQTRILLRATLWEWTINLVLNLGFIGVLYSMGLLQPYGLQAVALVTVFAYLFEKLYLASQLKKLNIPLSAYTPVRTWLVYVGVILLVFLGKMVFV